MPDKGYDIHCDRCRQLNPSGVHDDITCDNCEDLICRKCRVHIGNGKYECLDCNNCTDSDSDSE